MYADQEVDELDKLIAFERIPEPVTDVRFLPYSNALVATGRKNIYLIDFERLPEQCNPKLINLDADDRNESYMHRVSGIYSHSPRPGSSELWTPLKFAKNIEMANTLLKVTHRHR